MQIIAASVKLIVMFKISLILLILFAFLLRIFFVFQGAVSFHYDMSRDAYVAKQIWLNHDLKLIGPPTSTPGLYHGVFYYYLIALFYGIGNSDPRIVAILLAFLNSLTILPLMLLTKDVFKSTKWSILAGLFFAISFEATQYAAWISNPAPAILTVSLYFYFLRLWQKGRSWGLYGAVISATLSTQFQFFLIYLILLIPIFKILFKIKTKLREVGFSLFFTLLGVSSFLIAAVKFKTLGSILSGFGNISTSGVIDFRPQFSELFLKYINRFSEIFTYNFSPMNVLIGGLLGFLVLFSLKRQNLILFYLFSNFPIFIFGGHSNIYANIGLVTPAILGLCFLTQSIWKKYKSLAIILVFFIILSNFYAIVKNNPNGQIILVIPNDMVLSQELNLIDQTYKFADYKPFSINTLTLPLWTNTTWAYLYSWYGKNKYGYVPSFYGHNQIGLLGVNDLPQVDKPLDKTYLIIEPHVGIPENYYTLEIDAEDSKTDLISQIKYNDLILQIRKPKLNEKK